MYLAYSGLKTGVCARRRSISIYKENSSMVLKAAMEANRRSIPFGICIQRTHMVLNGPPASAMSMHLDILDKDLKE
jgi:hypothetical protein